MKKRVLSLISAGTLAVLSACSSAGNLSSAVISGDANFSKANLSNVQYTNLLKRLAPNGENVYVADVGKGIAGASFAVKINLGEYNFGVKASQDGKIFLKTDVSKFRVVLLEDVSGSAPVSINGPANVKLDSGILNVGGSVGAYNSGSGVLTVVFKDVPNNSFTVGPFNNKAYYVAASVYNAASQNIVARNSGVNATSLPLSPANDKLVVLTSNPSSPSNIVGIAGTFVAPIGGITVADNLKVSSVGDITGNITLDTIGADIGSTVNVSDGSNVPTLSPIVQ